eukprot:PITA_34569
MIKKNSNFKWGLEEHEAFNMIKQAIINAPSLATPNFSESFILYTFALEKSYVAILTQANQEKAEAPITFFSSNLQGAELNYSDVEKHAYAVFKAIKYFRPFLLKTHTKVIVPFPAVRNILIQKEVGEKRANWITALQEYDLEIKPASIVRGQGFYKMLAGASHIPESSSEEVQTYEKEVGEKRANWITALQEYDLEIKPISIVRGQGFCKMLAGASHIPESSSEEVQTYEVSLNDVESLYTDTIYYLKNGRTLCWRYHRTQDLMSRVLLAHNVQRLTQLREEMPNLPNYCRETKETIHATTAEAVPLKTANPENIIEFIDQFIITRFGLPSALIFDNSSYFSGNAMTNFALKRGFKLKYSSNYYPQGNGLAESTNKNLIRIIKRTVDQIQKNWHKILVNTLWADRITKKDSIDTSPFNLVYGKEVVLPTHLTIPSLSLVQYIDEVSTSSLQLRQMGIIKFEEQREQAKKTHAHHQALIKSSFDSSIMTRKNFQMEDLVLKWDKAQEVKVKHTKFQKMWLGPF